MTSDGQVMSGRPDGRGGRRPGAGRPLAVGENEVLVRPGEYGLEAGARPVVCPVEGCGCARIVVVRVRRYVCREGVQVFRRRRCEGCGEVFGTFDEVEGRPEDRANNGPAR
jgi:hypothetical protein